MKIDELVNQEMREAIKIDSELKAEIPSDGPWDTEAYRRQYNLSRAYWNRNGPVMAQTRDLTIDHEGKSIPCRIHYPKTQNESNLPALIFFHGGGWVVGNLDTHDRIMRELAHRSSHAVLGVDYPLSPETRFPDSYHDALHIAETVLSDGERFSLAPGAVSLGGDSAGAHISLYCALQLRKSSLPSIRALILIYGAFGLLDSASRRLFGDNDVGFSNASMDFYIQALMGDDVDPVTGGYDLLGNDLAGLPPSLITTCSLDLLRDDGVALAELMSRANVVNELVNYDGVLHGYVHMSEQVSDAVDTLERCADWLKVHS